MTRKEPLKKAHTKERLKREADEEPLKGDPPEERLNEKESLFDYFHPFKGEVPIAHQLDFQDAADRARALLKGWHTDDIVSAAGAALELHSEGIKLLREELREPGDQSYGRPTRTIYRAKEARTDPLTINGSPLRDSELFAAFSLAAIASACKELQSLERITDKTPDILADGMRRAGQMHIDQMAVTAQATIEHAEAKLKVEAQERSELTQRRQRARKAGLSRIPELRRYQWDFIQAWDSGTYKGRSRPYAARHYLSRHPLPGDAAKLQNPERSLVEALKRHEKGEFEPPK